MSVSISYAYQDNEPPIQISEATFRRGISELENAQIIAKTLRQGVFFINPNFVFNGDRVAFTTVIERRQKKMLQHTESQNMETTSNEEHM
jgi:DNA-binding GntR family transcriptional regulator